MASYKVGEQGFVLSGQSVLEYTLKGFAIRQIDPEFLTEENQITPSIPIAFRNLVDELLNPSRTLGLNFYYFAASDRHSPVEFAFKLHLEVGRTRQPLALARGIAALSLSEPIVPRRGGSRPCKRQIVPALVCSSSSSCLPLSAVVVCSRYGLF
jgi:hypothetical protein